MVSTKVNLVDVDNSIWPSATILPPGTKMTTWPDPYI